MVIQHVHFMVCLFVSLKAVAPCRDSRVLGHDGTRFKQNAQAMQAKNPIKHVGLKGMGFEARAAHPVQSKSNLSAPSQDVGRS